MALDVASELSVEQLIGMLNKKLYGPRAFNQPCFLHLPRWWQHLRLKYCRANQRQLEF